MTAIGKNLGFQAVIAAGANFPSISQFIPMPDKKLLNLPIIISGKDGKLEQINTVSLLQEKLSLGTPKIQQISLATNQQLVSQYRDSLPSTLARYNYSSSNKPINGNSTAVVGSILTGTVGPVEFTKSSRNNSKETIKRCESREKLPPRNVNTS